MSYQHLSEKERYVISHLQYSFSMREIARRLGRHHSTISREFKRAKNRHPWTTYYYDWSHPLALECRQRPRHLRRQNNQRLVAYVESRLRLEWSPDEIANRIRIDYPDDDQMRISHETIYRWGRPWGRSCFSALRACPPHLKIHLGLKQLFTPSDSTAY